MQEEYFDIVDENNVNTGEVKSRSQVHSTGLWHRTVHIYYFRKENDKYYFLVHLRSKTKDLHPNCWDTRFGGHVKAGETIEQALTDEIKEEIGLSLKYSDFIKGLVRKRDHYPNNEFTHIFFYKGPEDTSNLRFEDDEVQKVKWMDKYEIIKSMQTEPEKWSGSVESFKLISNELKKIIK